MMLIAQYFDKIEALVSKKEEKKTKITYLVLTLKSEVIKKKSSNILSFEHFEKAIGNEILKSLISRNSIRYSMIFLRFYMK